MRSEPIGCHNQKEREREREGGREGGKGKGKGKERASLKAVLLTLVMDAVWLIRSRDGAAQAGMVAWTCNPSPGKAEAGGQPGLTQ